MTAGEGLAAVYAYFDWVDAGNGTDDEVVKVAAFRSAMADLTAALDGLEGFNRG